MNTIVKNIFNSGAYSKNINLVLLVLRIVAGAFMLMHGLDKLERLFGSEPIRFDDPLGVGPTTSLALTVFAEALCSILLIIGLGTRLAAIPLLFTMLVVTFIVQAGEGLGRQELPLLYSAIYIVILVLGAGKYSLDYLISRKRKK